MPDYLTKRKEPLAGTVFNRRRFIAGYHLPVIMFAFLSLVTTATPDDAWHLLSIAERNGTLKILPLDNSWRFKPDPQNLGVTQGWSAASAETGSWTVIRSDLCAGFEQTDARSLPALGSAWYRQTVHVPPELASRKSVILLLGGVSASAEAFVNGESATNLPIAEWDRPYAFDARPRAFDIRPLLRVGQDNLVVVRAFGAGPNHRLRGLWKPGFLVGSDLDADIPELHSYITVQGRNAFGQAPDKAVLKGDAKSAEFDLPSDRPREHIETISASNHSYAVAMGGIVDGAMTRGPVSYDGYVQGWQANRSLLIENIGTTDVRNAWVLVNGKRNWRSLPDIVRESTGSYTQAADRVRAVWEWFRANRSHSSYYTPDNYDVVVTFNVFGLSLCGDSATMMSDLWREMGFRTRWGRMYGHSITEVEYDGAFHMLDGDENVICLKRDNRTLASIPEIARDHDLMKRTHAYGVLRKDSRATDEVTAAFFYCEDPTPNNNPRMTRHRMDIALRPGESLECRWDHVGRAYRGNNSEKDEIDGKTVRILLRSDFLARLANGRLRYKPGLRYQLAQRGVEWAENAVFETGSGSIRPADPSKPARVIWRFVSPYVVVGGAATGTVQLGSQASAAWLLATDFGAWWVGSATNIGGQSLTGNIDPYVSPGEFATFDFRLCLVLTGDAKVSDIGFDHTLQVARLSLPELELGANRITYSDGVAGDRRVRITHRWVERNAWHPPSAPAPVFPRNGRSVEGTQVTFRWRPSTDEDGDAIRDYHFQLSEHEDMRWVLSPNFDKLLSYTPFAGKTEWRVPYVGLLNGGQTYYWRVRACDTNDVWGPWTQVQSFTVKAPCIPLNVRLETNQASDELTLAWDPNPDGERPVAYKVYGSDEKGFTVSEEEYLVNYGKGFVRSQEELAKVQEGAPGTGFVKTPPNLVVAVKTTSMQVVGPGLAKLNFNKGYFRVVSVDRAGNESGPSAFVEVPRPFVYSRAPEKVKVGQPYRYEIRAIHSTGDCRKEAMWDEDENRFEAVDLPDGLAIQPLARHSAEIVGAIGKAGSFILRFKVTNRQDRSVEFSFPLIAE